ncbi:MAG TPA: hypothetical protein VMV95_03755 [Bacillota bacterium]|nr:hypothetical protein [Bacillota bacterium]
MIRYFNLEEGEKFGRVIKVNTSFRGLEKLSTPYRDVVLNPYTFKHAGVENEENIYEVHMPNQSAVNLKLILNEEGELRLHDSEQKSFHLIEISTEEARQRMELEKSWALQKFYIFE